MGINEILKNTLLSYSTCELCDGMDKLTAMDSSIKPFISKKRICGHAVTIDIPTTSCAKVMEAIEAAKSGDIIVIAAHGNCNTAMWGDYRTRIALKKGIEGIVIDGAFRDIEENLELGFPIYARTNCCGADVSTNTGTVNIPVICGGVEVKPGDIIVADANGVIAIDPCNIDEILAKAELKKQAQEAKIKALEK